MTLLAHDSEKLHNPKPGKLPRLFWNVVDSLLMPILSITRVDVFKRYGGGKCLRVGSLLCTRRHQTFTTHSNSDTQKSTELPVGEIQNFYQEVGNAMILRV